jgi:hypothetical protein
MYVALKITEESYPTYVNEVDAGISVPLEYEDCKNFYFLTNTSDITDSAWLSETAFFESWQFANTKDPQKFEQVTPR